MATKITPPFITRRAAAKIYGKLRGGNGNINTFVTALINRDDELVPTTKEKPELGDYYVDGIKYMYNPDSIRAFAKEEETAAHKKQKQVA